MTDQNKYRCETCGYYQTHHIKSCDLIERMLDTGEIALISKLGCASHSDFQSERDKVLDELDTYLDVELERASQFNAMRNFALLEVKRKIKEPRQQAGEQG
jgi:hypothetical protein